MNSYAEISTTTVEESIEPNMCCSKKADWLLQPLRMVVRISCATNLFHTATECVIQLTNNFIFQLLLCFSLYNKMHEIKPVSMLIS